MLPKVIAWNSLDIVPEASRKLSFLHSTLIGLELLEIETEPGVGFTTARGCESRVRLQVAPLGSVSTVTVWLVPLVRVEQPPASSSAASAGGAMNLRKAFSPRVDFKKLAQDRVARCRPRS
jgi:hypothetical protein